MRKVKLAVGSDGRNRTVLWPFKAKTSRTQPKASQWIFSPAVWLRSLIKPEPGMAVAYIDYSVDGISDRRVTVRRPLRAGQQHARYVLTRRSLSERSPKRVGAVPSIGHQESHTRTVRDKYKIMLLAVQYGMYSETLAARLGVSTFEAHEMLSQHREAVLAVLGMVGRWVQHALQTGVMRTAFGWTCRTGITEFNERSIRNWPVQVDRRRHSAHRLHPGHAARHQAAGTVHDAVLIEAPIERIEADVALMQEIMRRASRIVLNTDLSGTHELRTDYTIIRYPDRYSDKRGAQIWTEVLQLLAEQQNRTPIKQGQPDGSEIQGRFRQRAAVVAAEAAKATRMPRMLVLVELLYRSWKAKSLTFPLPKQTGKGWRKPFHEIPGAART